MEIQWTFVRWLLAEASCSLVAIGWRMPEQVEAGFLRLPQLALQLYRFAGHRSWIPVTALPLLHHQSLTTCTS